jgi:predicted PurR-regulated permease PerM
MSRYPNLFPMHRWTYWQRLLIFGLSGPLLALNLWILSQVFRYFEHLITLLTISAIIAFLLNYPVRFITRFYRSRSQAVILVLLITLTLLVVFGITLVPVVMDQITQLLKNIPTWLETSNDNLYQLDVWAREHRLPLNLRLIADRFNSRIESQAQVLATQVVGFAIGTLSGLLDTFLVIVLAFYMLLYGASLWQGMVSLLPPQIGVPLSESLRRNFQNFFISQILLALFIVATLTPIFLVLDVPFALLFALLIGVSELVPVVGASLGIGLVTILVMLHSFWIGVRVAIAAIIMQQIKDNLLAPRLMGEFIGLNPVVIFIALLVGVQVAGIFGVLVAVPIAGTIKGTIDAIRMLYQPKVASSSSLTHESSRRMRTEE